MLTCPDFSKSKIIVIGDIMLDRYWHGDTSRISPEAPVPVVKIDKHEERVGGAANVAVNVQALGAQACLIGVIGEDEAGRKLTEMLTEKGVNCELICSENYRTILKLRVLGRNQQLIRLDFENKWQLSAADIIKKLQAVAQHSDILILSDYAKGVLTQPQRIIEYARQMGIKVIVDPKNPDLSVYRGAHVLTPNLSEFEAAVGSCANESEIEQKGFALVDKLDLEGLLVTRGSQGMTLLQKNQPALHIPAQAKEVFDITGAGDTVIAVLGASLAAKTSMANAAKLANLAGGISVGRLGTATISHQELQVAVRQDQPGKANKGIMTQQALLEEVKRRKANGEKIIMTNGCFDILHAGHISYLQRSRDLGDCLIIAVNSDESVQRLKGPTRPVNNLDSRMELLAALRCVDLVVPFSEDTPEELYAQVLPHVLVKGGDYTPDQIAGAKQVQANGGEVVIMSFVPGFSTTSTLEKLSQHEETVEVAELVE